MRRRSLKSSNLQSRCEFIGVYSIKVDKYKKPSVNVDDVSMRFLALQVFFYSLLCLLTDTKEIFELSVSDSVRSFPLSLLLELLNKESVDYWN